MAKPKYIIELEKNYSSLDKSFALIASGMEDMKEDQQEIKAHIKEINDNVRDHETKIARLEERQGIIAGINTGVALVAATIAAWLGVSR